MHRLNGYLKKEDSTENKIKKKRPRIYIEKYEKVTSTSRKNHLI